jgi:antitoxin MazE
MALVKDMQLSEGDEVSLSAQGARDLRLRKKPGADEIVAALREFEGRLPVDFKFDREDANAR